MSETTMSQPPSSASADSLPAQDDVHAGPRSAPPASAVSFMAETFAETLHEAKLAADLREGSLASAAEAARAQSGPVFRLDLLTHYYDANGDPLLSDRRVAADRWFLYRADSGMAAHDIVDALLAVNPELQDARLERIGGEDGALVVRSGEFYAAVEDEVSDGEGQISVTVRELVRATNVLLSRHKLRLRLVALLGDGVREGYLGVSSMTSALQMQGEGLLAIDDVEALMTWAAW